MIGDYTKVPLRDSERWTGARMQQGRVLLEHEWNLNLDAADRAARGAARDVIGVAGVPVNSQAFRVGLVAGPDLTVEPGRIWVDGQAAHAPVMFRYGDQNDVPALPTSGRVLVFLDVFPEHLQPAEAWDEIVDPALGPVEAGARTRVGYRVRVEATTATSCQAALAALAPARLSTGAMTISRATPATTRDPCDPPGDPLGLLPNGLFRVEVLDGGSATTARFAWSGDDGAATARVRSVSGSQVTLEPHPAVKFAPQDTVEVSWTNRRADRRNHGPLYVVTAVTGDVVTLNRGVTVPDGAGGRVLRRWDGESVGAANAVPASLHGSDLGLRFQAATTVGSPPVAATYLTGDTWLAWLRPAAESGVEPRNGAPAEGTAHAFVALALVDFTAGTVTDCRPQFPPLTELPRSTCTVTAFPGDNLQVLADRLPAAGGELCLAAGRYALDAPVRITAKRRIVVTGVGPATVLAAARDCALQFENCADVEVTGLRAEGGAGESGLDGALTFVSCSRIRVAGCHLACADAVGDRSQTGLTVRGSPAGQPRELRIEDNRFEVGTRQIGLLVVDGLDVLIQGNDVVHAPTTKEFPVEQFAQELARVGADIDDTTNRYGPRLVALRAELRDRAAPLVQQGIPMRMALRQVARNRITEVGAARAHELVGAAGVSQLIAALQGIVVAGRRAQTIRVLGNVVNGATQGIHVGTSDPATTGRDQAGDVMIARNMLTVTLPAVYNRGRHAVFVGHVNRLSVLETFAEVRRLHNEERSAVDGIRVFGRLGPYLMVRESALAGFTTGVRIVPEVVLGERLWVVTDTLASGATDAVVAPEIMLRAPNVPPTPVVP